MIATKFDYSTADLWMFLHNVEGLNFLYRGRMLGVLRREENEMVELGKIFQEITKREGEEIESAAPELVTPEFIEGFLRLFYMNGGTVAQLTE